MRAANRRQHYVPQMYLKRFTEDEFHIYQFDTNTQKSKRYHIRNVCFEDHFYTSAELGSVEGSDPEFECSTPHSSRTCFSTASSSDLADVMAPSGSVSLRARAFCQMLTTYPESSAASPPSASSSKGEIARPSK